MRFKRAANCLVALVLLCASIAQAQKPSDRSVTSSKYEPQQRMRQC